MLKKHSIILLLQCKTTYLNYDPLLTRSSPGKVNINNYNYYSYILLRPKTFSKFQGLGLS